MKKITFRLLARTAAIAICLLAVHRVQAQPKDLLKFPFMDATGSTTTSSDVSLGGVNVTLSMFNSAGVATDFHGLVGSGVNGAINNNRAMTLTNGDGVTQPGNATGGGSGANAANYVQDASDTALGFGSISNFIVTMWVKQAYAMASGAGLVGPRLFILNSGAPATDTAVANSIGVKFQQANELYLSINTGNPTLGPALANNLPANQWLFFAWVYDGTNAYQYDGSDAAPCVLAGSAAAAGQIVNLGASASLQIGNRNAHNRGLNGWVQDFRFYTNVGTAAANLAFVEGIRQQLAPLPFITGLYPDGTALEQATNTLVFTAQSATGVNLTNFDVVLNGTDVSAGLTFVTNGTHGTSTNVSVTYIGLPQQQMNTVVITIKDTNGVSSSSTTSFDTYSPTNFIFEAEDFDFGGGQFLAHPDYTDGNPADTNSYYQLDSVEGIDTHKGPSVGDATPTDYRYSDGVGTRTQTPVATGELPSPKFANLLDGSGNAIVNHEINYWSSGEWQNYTKIFPAGNYNVYARMATASGSTVSFDQVTSGQGSTNQVLNNLGTFNFSGSGSFQWVPLMKLGSLAVVNLAGQHTVRATTGGGAMADFYMFVPANPNLPILSNVHPDGTVLFQFTNKLTFTVSSPSSTINTANIQVTLNGVNVSSGLVFSGGPSTWNVSYTGLQQNQTYVTSIHVVDGNGNTASGQLTIDTWVPLLQFEAEDFDFNPSASPIYDGTGNRFIDNAVPTAAGVAAANSYEGQTGVELIDQFGVGAGTRAYRPGDVATTAVTDTARAQFNQAHAQDYNIGFLGAGFWESYTRTWPAGTYNVYGRMASGASASGLPTPPGIRDDVNLVVAGEGTTNQILSYVGTFNVPTTNGYSAYQYVPLMDKYGNYAQVTLNGVETLRSTLDLTTTAGVAQFGLNINFYMLTAPRTDLVRIDSVYPDGTMLDQQTGSFSFVASSPQYGVNTTNIHLTLNGTDVSGLLSFNGSPLSWTVQFPGLQPDMTYTAVITVTDNNNQTHTTTVTFDTFSANNYTWEAEDFDFDPSSSPVPNGSGQRFIDNPALTSVPAANSYYGQFGDEGIDYAALFGLTHPGPVGDYVFRPYDDLACAPTTDGLRPQYLQAQLANTNANIQDYEVDYWDTNGWVNYTRTFPAGHYNVYARASAGNGPFAMQFSQVMTGAGTSSQTTQYLGSFVGSGTSFTTWKYVPLVNTNTGLPVVLSFGGVETFQVVGDYNEDINFFALVPALPTTASATLNGSQVLISFPTQSGFSYTVYYKNHLKDPSWQQLSGAVTGTGSVMTVPDNVGNATRFYQVGVQ